MNLIQNTTFLTIISGVLVFILSQWFVEYIIKPLQEYKKIKSQIAYDLVYFSNIYHNPCGLRKELYEEASKELRKDAAQIMAFSIKKPFDFLPTAKNMQEISNRLIGLSNSMDILEFTKEDIKSIIENENYIKKKIGLRIK